MSGTGPLALVGGGEFGHGTRDADGHLLASVGTDRIGLVAPKSSHEAVLADAIDHITSLGAGIDLIESAEDVSRCRFIHLCDTDPATFEASLTGSPLWRAILDAWLAGSALSASGGAASSLGSLLPSHELPLRIGLGLVPSTAIIPRCDSLSVPERRQIIDSLPEGILALGLDTETSAIWQEGHWTGWGPGTINIYLDEGERDYGPSDLISEIPQPVIP